MDQDITPEERAAFHRTLLSAFPRPGSLQQMVSFQLDKNLYAIAGGNNYEEVVFSLIQWAESCSAFQQLLTAARKANPTNSQLKAFEQRYLLRYQHEPDADTHRGANFLLPSELRTSLLEILVRIPGMQNYAGRSSLLACLPNSSALDRSSTNMRHDLEGIIDQLSFIGQLSSQKWPLIVLIDNALLYVKGFKIEQELQHIRDRLASLNQS